MRSLGGRLVVTYFLVVFIALAAVDLLVLGSIESFTLRQRDVAAFTAANIAVNMVEPYYRPGAAPLEGNDALLATVRTAAQQTGSRVLAVAPGGRVVADSTWPAGYTGRVLIQPEVAQALAGKAASGRRYLEGTGWVLYTVAPVLEMKQPVGAVFLSTSLEDIYAGLGSIARTMVLMSALALALATGAGLAVARSISGPLVRLTRAVERMGRGDLAQRVTVRGRDEVATLSGAFNDMARRLHEEDERRREFLADVAHELQTPVSAIRAMAEPLAAERGPEPAGRAQEAPASGGSPLPAPGAAGTASAAGPPEPRAAGDYDLDTYKEMSREMGLQAERLGRLVGDLLELARLEAPEVALVPEEVELAGLLRGVVHSLTPQATAAGVVLETGKLEPVTVIGDGLRLEEVFTNLAGNGIKYAGAGRRVRLDLERQGAEAVVTVADNGPGIPAGHLPHIFDRFYRVERSRSRHGGGTGLGLAIVKRIVQLHGGTVSARSREGEGTVFEVRLPAAR